MTHRNPDRCASGLTGPPGFTAASSLYTSQRGYNPLRSPRAAPRSQQRFGGGLHGYDVRWPQIFVAEQRRIRARLGSLAIAVEHVGSSAIPGLTGRHEIDIMVGVSHDSVVDKATQLLTGLGYLVHDRTARNEPWRLLVRPAQIPFELLVVEHGSRLWNRILYLREYLRDPSRARAYGRLKARWAAQYGAGTPGYQQAKREFWAAIEAPAPTS
jgi:GrpB-like predicted nucleotidyltransferase (UPF0157 family)